MGVGRGDGREEERRGWIEEEAERRKGVEEVEVAKGAIDEILFFRFFLFSFFAALLPFSLPSCSRNSPHQAGRPLVLSCVRSFER